MSLESDTAVKLQQIIATQLAVDPALIMGDTLFVEDLGADSLDVVELMMLMEEEFDIEIDDSDAEAMRTVQDALAYVTKRVAA